MQNQAYDENICLMDVKIRHITQVIENKCDQIGNQYEQLKDLKKAISQKLLELHEIETRLSKTERKQNLQIQKHMSFDNFEYQQLYEEYMLAKIKNTQFQHQLKENMLKSKEQKLHKKQLVKQLELHQMICEELTHQNSKIQKELKQKVDFLNKFGQLAHSKKIKNFSTTQSMKNQIFTQYEDRFVANYIKSLELHYIDNDIPFLIKNCEQYDDGNKQKDTDDELSLHLPRIENDNEDVINLECNQEQSEKVIQRTLQEEFEECLSDEEQSIYLISSLFI
ncbi:unnamed protein product (macronuclear) [Paramecium tetraurelia]|uniref:Uncharacterized protein n=1 Tax=Paramecium tetraurelia TaxID=5888 RepID=A0BTQ0_PARTE|nr:uncharacterized protein GSPATT00032149001 [Paramecium tetraurelia]CAK61917.1 unnamed protein product [Paramecium tetraurelia]|eukprot:XP_001429315.1 hypothetical protein (macronuclear) [Paramecium tetraurelia strain d4-2]